MAELADLVDANMVDEDMNVCPLRMIGGLNTTDPRACLCIGKYCALWNSRYEECALKAGADAVDLMRDHLINQHE